MNDLQVINQDGVYVIDSREVAKMTGKQHKDLLETIRGYEQFLLSGEFRSEDFFISSTYQDSTGRTLPNYLLTRKGCDMVANKMTGEKGVLFTATYVTKFEEMEKQLSQPDKPKPSQLHTWDRAAISEIRFAKEWAKIAGVRTERSLAVALSRIENETGKQLNDYRKTLPAVNDEDAEILNAGQIGERLEPQRKASEVNLILEKMGLQLGKREPSKKTGKMVLVKRNPWNLTEKGKEYGIMQDTAKSEYRWEGFQIMWSVKVVETVKEFLAKRAEVEQVEAIEGDGSQ